MGRQARKSGAVGPHNVNFFGEVGHCEGSSEPGRPSGGQDVAGTRDVVSKRSGRPGATEHSTGVMHLVSQAISVGNHQL